MILQIFQMDDGETNLATDGLQILAVRMTNALLELVEEIVDTYLTQAGGYSVLDSGVGWRGQ